jgi:hypothetical protein
MLPDEKIMCHHTAFEKRCFDMVTQSKCRKWRNLVMTDVQTGERTNHWDCVEGLQHQIQLDTGRAVMNMVASLDKLATEVSSANDSGMANALMGLNAQVRRMAEVSQDQVDMFITDDRAPKPKMIGSN